MVHAEHEVKNSADLARALTGLKLHQSSVVIYSGNDAQLGNILKELLQDKIKKTSVIPEYEQIIFANEKDEYTRLQSELENIPLFHSYRLLIVKQAEEVLRPLTQSRNPKFIHKFQDNIKNIAPHSLVLFLYNGQPGRKLLQELKSAPQMLHLYASRLYANQLEGHLKTILNNYKLRLEPETFFFLLERVSHTRGGMEEIARRLGLLYTKQAQGSAQQSKPTATFQNISLAQVQSILQSRTAWDPFLLVDSLFAERKQGVLTEYKNFSESAGNNFFAVLKLIQKRLNDIRFARIGFKYNLGRAEIMKLVKLHKRHPYFQEKTLQRLRDEAERFDEERLVQIYRFTIDMFYRLRSNIPAKQQALVFGYMSYRVFFRKTKPPK